MRPAGPDGRGPDWVRVTVLVEHRGGRIDVVHESAGTDRVRAAGPDVAPPRPWRDVLDAAVKDARSWLARNPPTKVV